MLTKFWGIYEDPVDTRNRLGELFLEAKESDFKKYKTNLQIINVKGF
jgi:hypothetical protein